MAEWSKTAKTLSKVTWVGDCQLVMVMVT